MKEQGRRYRLGRPRFEDLLSVAEQGLLGPETGVYDARFITVLNKLQEEGRIRSWYKTPDLSQDDHAGIDWWIRIKKDEIPFQTTGDVRDARRHRAHHPDIPSIFIRNRYKPGIKEVEELKQIVLEKAEWYLKGKRRHLRLS